MDLGSVSEEIDHLVKAYLLALYTGPDPWSIGNRNWYYCQWIWDQELMMYKRQGVQVSQYCIPLYVSNDLKG